MVKRIFINADNSEGISYLATSDLELDGTTIAEIYQKRWKTEEYHKSLKQNAALARSPAKTVRTQANHIFASLYAFCKLQVIAGKQKLALLRFEWVFGMIFSSPMKGEYSHARRDIYVGTWD